MIRASIECQRLSKSFVLRSNRQYLLKDTVLALIKPRLRERREILWALRDVDFSVEPGETFGVIGPNGSGKTTLFRLISRILQPTSGVVRVHGRLAPLLALGIGFHPELTGRENIYVSAALFGFTTREIRAIEQDVIDFSELSAFVDIPTKNYSSGMQLRLGFAIAVNVRPEVFLIDESFAVGDEHFQQKCLVRLEEERRSGRTFLIATHDMQFVEERCDRAMLVVHGRLAALGRAKDVVRAYREYLREQGLLLRIETPANG
jgi:homopolymeric O-antigen transport system ATP-binding protein